MNCLCLDVPGPTKGSKISEEENTLRKKEKLQNDSGANQSTWKYSSKAQIIRNLWHAWSVTSLLPTPCHLPLSDRIQASQSLLKFWEKNAFQGYSSNWNLNLPQTYFGLITLALIRSCLIITQFEWINILWTTTLMVTESWKILALREIEI